MTAPAGLPSRPEPPQSAGRAVTGRDVRAVLGVASAGLLFAALAGADYPAGPLAIGAALVVAAVASAFPASPAPTAVCVVSLIILLAGDVGYTAWLVVVASLIHTVHVLAGLGEIVPARSRAEIGALMPTARRWLRAQVLTVPVLTVVVALLA